MKLTRRKIILGAIAGAVSIGALNCASDYETHRREQKRREYILQQEKSKAMDKIYNRRTPFFLPK